MCIFKVSKSLLVLALIVAFLGASVSVPSAQAGEMVIPAMPVPGTMVSLSQAFTPAHLQGLTVNPKNALQFDFLIRKSDSSLSAAQKEQEYAKLVKYFLASLTVADKDQWVNLSPYEKNRIIEDQFGKTDMGRDLLAQDYLLKQITSSLMFPESGMGKSFWDKVYAELYKRYGTTSAEGGSAFGGNIPVNTFNKVWVVPDKADVYESGNTVYILNSHLKVMLEQDYLSRSKHRVLAGTAQQSSTAASQAIRDVILPAIEKEVNEGKNFAALRQIYSAMVLATWYKKALKESLLGKIYADKAKVSGINQPACRQTGGPCVANEEIYQQYIAAFKKGVYNYIKEEPDTHTGQVIPRKYFAGGFGKGDMAQIVKIYNANDRPDRAQLERSVADARAIDRASVSLVEDSTGSASDDRDRLLYAGALEDSGWGGDAWEQAVPDGQLMEKIRSTPRFLTLASEPGFNALRFRKTLAEYFHMDVPQVYWRVFQRAVVAAIQLGKPVDDMDRREDTIKYLSHILNDLIARDLQILRLAEDRFKSQGITFERVLGRGVDGIAVLARQGENDVVVKLNVYITKVEEGLQYLAFMRANSRAINATGATAQNLAIQPVAMHIIIEGEPREILVVFEVNEFVGQEHLQARLDKTAVDDLKSRLALAAAYIRMNQKIFSAPKKFVMPDAQNLTNVVLDASGAMKYVDFQQAALYEGARHSHVLKEKLIRTLVRILLAQDVDITDFTIPSIDWDRLLTDAQARFSQNPDLPKLKAALTFLRGAMESTGMQLPGLYGGWVKVASKWDRAMNSSDLANPNLSMQSTLLPATVIYDEQKSRAKIRQKENADKIFQLAGNIRAKLGRKKGAQLNERDIFQALFGEGNEDITRLLVELASMMRQDFGNPPIIDALPSLAYAVKNNYFIRIGANLYISPMTQSFRRHLIFKTDKNGRVIFAYELMIPGDLLRKRIVNGLKRGRIADDINQNYSGKQYSAKVVATRKIPYEGGFLYGKRWRGQSIECAVFEYKHDSRRLPYMNESVKRSLARELGISTHELDKKITVEAIENFLAVKFLGHLALTDMHPENLRLNYIYGNDGRLQDVQVQLVADFGIYQHWRYNWLHIMFYMMPPVIVALKGDPSIWLTLISLAMLNSEKIIFFFSPLVGLYWHTSLSAKEIAASYTIAWKNVFSRMSQSVYYRSAAGLLKAAVSSAVGARGDAAMMSVLLPNGEVSGFKKVKREAKDSAMMTQESAKNPLGGIDMNAAHLNLQIRRDGRGVPLPLAQQDMAQLSRVQGFVPRILEIRPAASLPILSELKQQLQPKPAVLAGSAS